MVFVNRNRAPVLFVALILVTGLVALVTGRQLVQEPPKSTDWRKLGYKTTKPTIGILAQRCHDCPGRYVTLVTFEFSENPTCAVKSVLFLLKSKIPSLQLIITIYLQNILLYSYSSVQIIRCCRFR